MRDKITYLGQSYPVDLDKGLVGTLTDEEIEKYSKGVNQRINYEDGNNNNIYFQENYAIRSSKYQSSSQSINICLKNFLIGNDLRINGLNAPKMFGIYFGKEAEKPFLIMERKKLIFHYELNPEIQERLKEEIKQELKKIRLMGYQPQDHFCNFRFESEKGRGVFFDFDNWESEHFIPQLNEKGELIIQNPVRMFSRNPQRNKQEGELIR